MQNGCFTVPKHSRVFILIEHLLLILGVHLFFMTFLRWIMMDNAYTQLLWHLSLRCRYYPCIVESVLNKPKCRQMTVVLMLLVLLGLILCNIGSNVNLLQNTYNVQNEVTYEIKITGGLLPNFSNLLY